ncbi:hypothetical protein D3C72_1162610 [compost metagenome]
MPDGLLQGRCNPRRDRLIIALVRTEEEGEVLFQPEGAFGQHMSHRGVGRQPQGQVGAQIADVVGARGPIRAARPPIRRGPQPHRDARRPRQGPHHPRKGDGAIDARMLQVTRREIENLDRGPAFVGHHRAQDGGVADIGLFDRHPVGQFDGPEAVFGIAAVHQGREDRIAVDARGAGPDETGFAVDQGADRTVADGGEVEVGTGHA